MKINQFQPFPPTSFPKTIYKIKKYLLNYCIFKCEIFIIKNAQENLGDSI